MVEQVSLTNPFGQEAKQFVENVMPKIRQKIDSAIVAGWLIKTRDLFGAESPSSSWVLSRNQEHPKFSELKILDQKPKSAKVSRYMISVMPKTGFRLKGFLGSKSDFKIIDYKVESEKGFGYKYDAGRRLEDYVEDGKEFDAFVPAISSQIILIEDGDDVRLESVTQDVKLNNAAVGLVSCEAMLIGRVIEDKFGFVIDVLSAEDVGGRRVKSSFMKAYEPIVQTDGEIKFIGHDIGAEVGYDLPEPFTSKVKEDEVDRFKKGRARSATIARFLPKNFSQEEARQMFANIVDGKMFTAGVINPLELAGVRCASKKSSR